MTKDVKLDSSAKIVQILTEEDTAYFASKLAKAIKPPFVVSLSGIIGAGKTTFVREFLRSLGVVGAIKSPTFTLVETYEIGGLQYHHFDLYRIVDESELGCIGFRDYFTDSAILLIEWPQLSPMLLEKTDLELHLNLQNNERELIINAKSKSGYKVLEEYI